ncbi:MAG: hybrid sensor histidine kinase/response regulator [Desulfobacterium sp.]|nr:hybrid sensor histidine kinase/response regulator [Desulfobacterium sp.]
MNHKATILAVDDTHDSLELLIDILTPEGYQVRPADSGELALSAVATNPPDLILLDVRMKGMDGFEVIRRLKAREETRHIPIILISAFAKTAEWVEGLQLGAADYIIKPFQIEELLIRVKTHLAIGRSEKALQEREEIYRNLFNNAEVGIFRSRLDGSEVLEVNRRFLDIVGMTIEETLGKPSVNLWADPKEREEMVKMLVAEGHVSGFEYRMLNKRLGEVRNCLTSLRLYREQGLLEGSILDITDRKRAEEEKIKLETQLQQAQKMESIGRLAGGVAHDFNNMLSIILGYADMALDKLQPSDPVRYDIQEIISAGQRSVEVVRQLLAFARKQTISPKILDLNDTITNILKMLRHLIGEDIDLLWKPADDLWPVKMDPSQIDQLLANLAVNSRDAIKDVGKITIETANIVLDADYCEIHAGFKPGEYVLLDFSDNGCGMDKETLANIFEPFFTTKDVGKGTGLGLATIYGIIKQNEGFINVYSEPGQGSTFKIYLPRYPLAEATANEKVVSTETPTGVETVLLVEDEKVILKLGKAMLKTMGYTVLTANTPDEAIHLAGYHAGEIHLLMTDVIMPEMNGRDLYRQLKALNPKLKSLFMSGYTADVIAHHGVLDDKVHFIHKPFSRKDLAVKVRKALDQE